MTVNQEEGSELEDYYYSRVHKALSMTEEVSTMTVADTEILKAVIEETQVILKDYMKFIETFERKLQKQSAKDKVREMLRHEEDL